MHGTKAHHIYLIRSRYGEEKGMTKTGQPTAELSYSRKQVFMALATVFLVYLTYSYYIQTPGIAAPKMAADLDGMALYSWSVSIPGLGLAFGTLLVGKLSDIYGRRSMMLASLAIFLLGAVMSALSPTFVFLIARTKHYRWLYIVGYAIITAVMFGMIFFDSNTPVFWGLVVSTLAGLGLGAIPTINTLVVQYAVPKRLLGVAMGALFFGISMGVAVAPAVLGSAMNIQYNSTLQASLPAALTQVADEATMTSLGNPRVLLSEPAMIALRETLGKRGADGQKLFEQTVQAIRTAMEAGLRAVFIIGAVTMLLSFLLIATVPEIAMEDIVEEKKAP
jgi:MFS family permease